MLDEPTTNDPNDPADQVPAEVKPVRRRRATTAVAAPAAADLDTAPAQAATGESPDDADATDVPAKRARKAPAKKAAPRKRAAKAVAPEAVAPEPVAPAQLEPGDDPADDALPTDALPSDTPLSEQELETAAVAAALADVGEQTPGTEGDPATPGPALGDPGTSAVDAPAKRTRTRRPAVVTFQAPEPVAPLPADDDDGVVAPRRRRRAGTAAAGAPGALELIEPVPAAEPPRRSRSAASDELAPEGPTEGELDGDDDDEDGDRPRRRRRGRRGRGPRRPEDEAGADSGAADSGADGAEADATTEGAASAEGDDDDETANGTRRRRRRSRSRTGASASDEAGDNSTPAPAPAPAREPRAPRSRGGGGSSATTADEDGVRGISGSTRMAAKRVRRQEGRDSGRKRTPLLSEAEFLARREAVDRTMIVRQKGDRTQIAVLEDGVLVEHYVTRASAQSFAGNVYLGRVQNVLPSMEAAFVDIGKSRNAVLYAGEVNDNASVGGRSRSIESVLKSGQEVLVQVSKDPIGSKGSRLTGQVSLPGRYLVYVPEGSMTGISRKLPETERSRLKSILKKVVPDDAGVIIRTAAEGASEQELGDDVRRLQAQWEVIQAKAAKGGAPALLHAEPDLVIRVVRDVFNEDFTSLVVQGDSEWETIREYVEFVAPDLAPRLSRHTSDKDVFAEHRVDEQLLKALDRKVYLPSGGSLVIDRTEAMVVVDVNTGKFVGKGGNLEETVTRNNLEAAEEIARQLRLRDLGGIIVVDFIDMVLESNRDLVVRRLVECLGRDRTKHQVAEVTSLGLVQMTRKRVGQGLLESFSEPCEACNGRGVHVHTEPVDERRGGGGGDEPRRERAPRVRSAKPLPADAPKPGAPIAGAARAEVEATGADGADGAAEQPAAAVDAEAPPKRRRRGGRGTGAATVPAAEELAEILAPVEDGPPTAGPEVEPAVAEVPDAELAELLDEPAGRQDRPALPDTTVDGDLDLEANGRAPVESADSRAADSPAAVGVPAVGVPAVEVPELEGAAPRRRRRATSRPAGPPPV